MSPAEAMERINLLLSHAWMVRQFIKHSEDAEEDQDMQDVQRMIFDYIRALEPSYEQKDSAEYLHRARGKLGKLKKQAEFFSAAYQRVSVHTNYQMAATSLAFVVRQIEETLASVSRENP